MKCFLNNFLESCNHLSAVIMLIQLILNKKHVQNNTWAQLLVKLWILWVVHKTFHDYRRLQSMIMITSNLEKVWLWLRLWLHKKCNRLQSFTVKIVISPHPGVCVCVCVYMYICVQMSLKWLLKCEMLEMHKPHYDSIAVSTSFKSSI